jgi:hypothetical protein
MMALASGSRQADSPSYLASTGPGETHDVVFTFYGETWTDAQGRACYMAGDRLLLTLLNSQAVRNLVVANPCRSAPIQLAHRLAGQRSAPRPADSPRLLIEPRRARCRDATSVRALERAHGTYDRALQRAAARVGAHQPAVITTIPFVAGFAHSVNGMNGSRGVAIKAEPGR